MTKKEVQKRVLQNGEPLTLDKFEWDEKTNTFSSNESDLVLDFVGVICCTFNTGSYCTFNTGSDCTFKTGEECVVVRRDVYEVIELDRTEKIKLNGFNVEGYKVIEEEPEVKEMTLKDVCKELGYEVKIKKE